ncbi:MAG: carbohydrate ABC transporter permease, partial [Oscillatoriales cyanobacterium RU_3_3]|nr:carbohydrate ABC transporter permease [Oscillatoriales cyanobacterium RU_3_3]
MNRQNLLKVLLYAVLIGYSIVTFLPFAWALSASFKPLAEIGAGGANFLPQNFTLDNYRQI